MATATTKAGGQALRTLRKRHGLTQDQLSDASGLSQPYISQIESGYYELSPNVAWRVCSALGEEPITLLQHVPPPRTNEVACFAHWGSDLLNYPAVTSPALAVA